MQVNFYATLRQIVGTKTVEFEVPEGSTVRQLLDEILRVYPALRPELVDAQGELYSYVHFFVNGRDVPYLEDRMETVLQADDKISVFPAVGGG